MKKLKYLFASMILIALVVSCSKDSQNDDYLMLKSGSLNIASFPVSDQEGITPYIIPGSNRGGNRTCAEVASAFSTSFDLCDIKRDYIYVDTDGNGITDSYVWNVPFPSWLHVEVVGNIVNFSMDGCVLIEGKYYKVGAVIVKGSNKANVYFYSDGTLYDSGLAAPGGNRMVSNLTFCFVECEEELPCFVIAFKTYIQSPEPRIWAVTIGEESELNVLNLGYVDYYCDKVNEYQIYERGYIDLPIGILTASDYVDPIDRVHYLEIVVIADGLTFAESYLYIGSEEGFDEYLIDNGDGTNLLNFRDFPFFEDELLTTRTFKIPFSEIFE